MDHFSFQNSLGTKMQKEHKRGWKYKDKKNRGRVEKKNENRKAIPSQDAIKGFREKKEVVGWKHRRTEKVVETNSETLKKTKGRKKKEIRFRSALWSAGGKKKTVSSLNRNR